MSANRTRTDSEVLSVVPMETKLPQVPDSPENDQGSDNLTWKDARIKDWVTNDFMNNEVSKALASSTTQNGLGVRPSMAKWYDKLAERSMDGPVDWTKTKNRETLAKLRKLIRTRFWALHDAMQADMENNPAPAFTTAAANVPDIVVKITRHEKFVAFYMILTIYALFGPDTLACFGHTAMDQENKTLAVINTFVLVAFIVEQALMSLVVPGYVLSLRFWIDSLATFSIIGDSIIGAEYLTSDAFVAMRGSRLTKVLRVGGRSSKLVRFVQLVRFVPRLQQYLQRRTNELAFHLWCKRLKQIFFYLDQSGRGVLTETDIIFFNAAMEAEFPTNGENLTLIQHLTMKVFGRGTISASIVMPEQENDLNSFIQEFISTPRGKKTFQRCREDIDAIKESCAMVETASDKLTLKVCILVLMLLITMQLLLNTTPDTTKLQGIHQIDTLSVVQDSLDQDSYDLICDFVKDKFAKVFENSFFLVLVTNYKVYWQAGCKCCDYDDWDRTKLSEENLNQLVNDVKKATNVEDHEFKKFVIEDADGRPRTVLIYDDRQNERALASNSLFQTVMVVVLLISLVLYFATDMRKLSNENVLHPLWNLMDDMCSLRSIEILSLGQDAKLNKETAELLKSTVYVRHFAVKPTIRFPIKCRSKIPVADELMQLRKSFDKLQVAMQSWSKYVPLILLSQLLEAHVEASIGCSFVEATVVFIAIRDFKGVCEHMDAQQVLDLLSEVFQAINDALEEHGGTMLEFIGDEVLAVFNAPTELKDHQTKAIRSALKAQDLVSKLRHKNVFLLCSAHKARVLAGNLGSPTRMKYGVLGDGVNLSARLKSLNTRYNTMFLVSADVLDFDFPEESFVMRPIGDLILKGRTSPTRTFEVLSEIPAASEQYKEGVRKHKQAFELFQARGFEDARSLFKEAHDLLASPARGGDQVAIHFIELCDKYIECPPDDLWDGSEFLTKKSF